MVNEWLKQIKMKQIEYSVFLVNQISERASRKSKTSIIPGGRGILNLFYK